MIILEQEASCIKPYSNKLPLLTYIDRVAYLDQHRGTSPTLTIQHIDLHESLYLTFFLFFPSLWRCCSFPLFFAKSFLTHRSGLNLWVILTNPSLEAHMELLDGRLLIFLSPPWHNLFSICYCNWVCYISIKGSVKERGSWIFPYSSIPTTLLSVQFHN